MLNVGGVSQAGERGAQERRGAAEGVLECRGYVQTPPPVQEFGG